jgi:hypothetical protein
MLGMGSDAGAILPPRRAAVDRRLTARPFRERVSAMPARSGAEYVESIRKQPPCVYLGGRRVADVTA